jgi:hypothetical protein
MHRRHLTEALTRWPRSGAGYGAGELFAPGQAPGGVRWTHERRNRIANEGDRGSIAPGSVLTATALAVGDCIAAGDHTAEQPADVPGVHEVIEVKETRSLIDSPPVLRATVRPLLGQLWQAVTIFAMERIPTSRGYTVERGTQLYTGPASVDFGTGSAASETGSAVQHNPVTVTVPYTAGLVAGNRYEVEFEALVLDAMGIAPATGLSHFWHTLSCTATRPRT